MTRTIVWRIVEGVSTNEELWVEAGDFGRCRLDGNAHTFPGRIRAWSETLDAWVTISRSDVREATPEAWAWIEGFLAGHEPELHEFLGIDAIEGERLSDEDSAHEWYRGALDHFHRTGSISFPLTIRPTLPPPPGLPIEPWSAAGGQVLRWSGSAWVPMDPQPELHFALLAGTICDERGHHDLDAAGADHMLCADCGELTEVEPQ